MYYIVPSIINTTSSLLPLPSINTPKFNIIYVTDYMTQKTIYKQPYLLFLYEIIYKKL